MARSETVPTRARLMWRGADDIEKRVARRTSPATASSTCEGSRRAAAPPIRNSTVASRRSQSEPSVFVIATPTAAAIPDDTSDAMFSRAFEATSPSAGGRTRMTAAARATPYARCSTRIANAWGYSASDAREPASVQATRPRPAVVSASTLRRPCGKRSSAGPATGTSSEKGSSVISR